jgi:hypothetical protein
VIRAFEALPYYRWHWRDYRANRKVQRMTYVERGLYRELLDECWAEGFISDDLGALAEVCGCPRDVLARIIHESVPDAVVGRCRVVDRHPQVVARSTQRCGQQ